ncbi:alpha-galactosidase [Bacteroides ovatus]|jgi:putative a-galactosidase|uniref:glycoside hydrolase family 27 protein n=1 Tax=Bacteroides TaxID=816 RepID=UPI000E7E063C|nr:MULTISPECIES: glycoside hydrolase family 27 protein [Bacteroides]MCS3175375.1 glycoside hydrolase family 27 protein [Candidatus Bacteroides intestinigallinarum]RGN65824.1 glycoside hydrolase family 27 protein [Bacteroides sp. OM05-10AA]RGQ68126.1 glycoside hydrolase family 27 protein [Bacteroides sp. AF27-33]CAG9898001.1 alpha-galactosidase [Bacteroides ovatus]
MRKNILFLLLFLTSLNVFAQKFEGLALTPQMGWNSWNKFGTDINEQMVKEMADALVSTGLRDAGYNHILLDDGWMEMERDAQGNLVPHRKKFPNGIKVVADYVHSKGLKFGLYNCAGSKTCAGYPGSRGHEYQDALKYAEWGVDYLKYDWCSTGKLNAEEAYITMRDAIYTAGRPILLSICEWGTDAPWKWAQSVGHSWRTTGDIYNCFSCKHDHGGYFSWGALNILDMRDQDELRKAAGPDHWNDMDMLEVGNGGLTPDEERTHFALWTILNSPLLLGNDLRNMSPQTLDILTNKEIIAINQDSLGIQGFKYKKEGTIEVWVKPMANNEWAICFFNRSQQLSDFTFNWERETIKDNVFDKEITFNRDNIYKIRDLYQHKVIGNTKKALKQKLEPNQSLVVKIFK